VGRVAPSVCSNSRYLRRFTYVDHTTALWPPEPPGAGCNSFRSRLRCRPSGRGGFVPRTSHPAVAGDARLSRVRLAEQPVDSARKQEKPEARKMPVSVWFNKDFTLALGYVPEF